MGEQKRPEAVVDYAQHGSACPPAASRPPVDPAQISRRSVRRRATGMTHAKAEAALEYAQFDRRQSLRHEESANDGGRGEAELAERERIIALLAGTGEVYDPQADAVVLVAGPSPGPATLSMCLASSASV